MKRIQEEEAEGISSMVGAAGVRLGAGQDLDWGRGLMETDGLVSEEWS